MIQSPHSFVRSAMTPAIMCALAGALSSAALASTPTLQPRSGDPVPGLTTDQLDRFFKGKSRFEHVFTFQEGLGPTFNETDCAICHGQPTTGGSSSKVVRRFGALNWQTEEFDPLEVFGGSLNQAGTIHVDCEDRVPTQQEVDDYFDQFGEAGLWDLIGGDSDPVHRVTNATFGAGLVESIDDADLLAHAVFFADGTSAGGSPPAVPGPGLNPAPQFAVEGQANMVESFEDAIIRVGRFGWKAQVATMLTFSADAARNEQGITNRFIHDAPAPFGDAALLAWCEDIPGLNDQAPQPINDIPAMDPFGEGVEFIDRVDDFQRFLSPPPQTPRSGMTGEQIFLEIGCGQCHVPSFTTKDDPNLEDALRNKVIKPYSDFLLHDMGLLGDQIVQGDAGGRVFRTPSLWGLRDREPILHDGRVFGSFPDRIEQAVDWHAAPGSRARASAHAYIGITNIAPGNGNNISLDNDDDRALVVAFLDSLGRVEFDYTGNRVVDDADFQALIGCYSDTASYMPANWAQTTYPDSKYDHLINEMDHPCAVFDINQDGVIDETDFEAFLVAYEGSQSVCSLWNQLADGVDPSITVPVPSECRPSNCPADLTNSGVVNVFSLLELLSQWGTCPAAPDTCPADLNSDGVVNVFDLLDLLAQWGPCP